jgi:hypothetical protein
MAYRDDQTQRAIAAHPLGDARPLLEREVNTTMRRWRESDEQAPTLVRAYTRLVISLPAGSQLRPADGRSRRKAIPA